MKRRNFLKGFLSTAAAPLAIPTLASTPKKQNMGAKQIEICDITLPRQLRLLEMRMVAHNVQPFPDGFYRGDIGLTTARQLLDDYTIPLRDGVEFQFAGFRLTVRDDGFGGVAAWGRP